MAGLEELTGTDFGSLPLDVDPLRVAEFARSVGDEPDRWEHDAPPMFANAALFTTAPAFLDDPEVRPFTRSLIHSDQTFVWHRPLAVGERLEVSGRVDAVRVRGSLNLVTFAARAWSDRGEWLDSTSGFVMSQESAGGEGPEEPEPDADDRPDIDGPLDRATLPSPGAAIDTVRCGASRSDLVRYAEASGDANPIHLDHEAARAAGLGGVVVHGLLMGAWLARVAGRYGTLDELRLRFRSPLRPAVAAQAEGVVRDDGSLDLALTASGERLVTGRASVTP